MWTNINLPIFYILPLITPLWHISYSSARHSVEKCQHVCHIIIKALVHGQVGVRTLFWPTFRLINVTILTSIYSWWSKNPNSIIAKLILTSKFIQSLWFIKGISLCVTFSCLFTRILKSGQLWHLTTTFWCIKFFIVYDALSH